MFNDDTHTATPGEAHLEWHRNAGVPVGQPCPWDACDPYAGADWDYDDQENLVQFVAREDLDGAEPF